MIGGFGENFPYSNFHDLNMDWIIKIAKDFLDQYTHLQETISDGEQSLSDLTADGLAELQEKEEALEALLDDWYTEHSEDIANDLADALEDLNDWYTEHQGYLDDYLQDSISDFNDAADAKAAETIASIPDNYTALSNKVTALDTAMAVVDTITPISSSDMSLAKNVDAYGEIVENLYTALSKRIPATTGDKVIRLVPERDSQSRFLLYYVSEFKGSTFLRRTNVEGYGTVHTVGNDTDNIMVSFGRITSSGVQISSSDVTNYFATTVYRQASIYSDDFIIRGNIADLEYTALSQCIEPGYYFLTSTDSLSDRPSGFTAGGILLVFRKELGATSSTWQELISTTGTWIRYGVSGTWYDKHSNSLILAEYASGAGSDDSTEQLHISIPINDIGTRMKYSLGHCVKASVNADVWRIMYAYLVKPTGQSRQMTIHGEWECAVKIDGRSDFSGGQTHGDEVMTSVTAFVDGLETDIEDIGGYCKEIKIVRKSNLYDPNDGTTLIAEHGVEYIFNQNGLTINQSINWKVEASLTTCYLAMLPIAKAYSQYRFDNTSFNVVENTQTSYSVNIPKATEVTEYSDTYEDMFTMGVGRYPSGMTGGDCALISDNGGLGYNKVYFPVCSSANVDIGTLWMSTTYIKNK